ncbi:unnamed protein product, partial [Phaeothamnion confervicola]
MRSRGSDGGWGEENVVSKFSLFRSALSAVLGRSSFVFLPPEVPTLRWLVSRGIPISINLVLNAECIAPIQSSSEGLVRRFFSGCLRWPTLYFIFLPPPLFCS